MVDWQVTATSIYCDSIGDEVTVIVHKDWSVKCTGHSKYGETGKQVSGQKKSRRQMGRDLKCEGLNCQQITRYKEKLAAEEAKKGKG